MAITTLSFGQKKEISNAFKAVESNDISTASAQLSAADNLLNGNLHLLPPELQEQYYFAKGMLAIKHGNNNEGAGYLAKIANLGNHSIYTGRDTNKNRVYFVGKTAADASGIAGLKEEKYTPKHIGHLASAINPLIQKTHSEALNAYNSKNYSEAGEKFEQTYQLLSATGKNDGQTLYNAALSYMNAKDYDKAISAFKTLIDTRYTGVQTLYTAKNKTTGKVENFEKATWDLVKQSQEYTDFKTETTKNIEADLYDYYSALLIDTNRNDEAIPFLEKALMKFPNHSRLATLQGLAYYKAGRTEEFAKSLRASLKQNPNDAMNWYNLGVVLSNDEKTHQEAKNAFERAIAIDDKMENAYQNLGNLLMGDDDKAVEKIRAAKGAEKDRLLEERRARFRTALPVFEKWYSIAPNNIEVVTMLKGLYQSTKNEAKYNEFKAKETALKQK